MNSYSDGDFSLASPAGPEVYSMPISGVAVAYLRTCPMRQDKDQWAPLAIGTPLDTTGIWMLVQESDPQPVGANLVGWNRVYARVPDTHEDWESTSYNFIGFWADPAAASVKVGTAYVNYTGRSRFTMVVPCKVVSEYFAVGAGRTYATPGAIPVAQAQKYYWGANKDSAYLATDALTDEATHGVSSTPSQAEYKEWISSGRMIVASDSTLSRWMGNIYRRQTIYVQAR